MSVVVTFPKSLLLYPDTKPAKVESVETSSRYPPTAVLSVEAVQERVKLEVVGFVSVKPVGTVGGVVSWAEPGLKVAIIPSQKPFADWVKVAAIGLATLWI